MLNQTRLRLEPALFPVEERDVFFRDPSPEDGRQGSLFEGDGSFVRIPRMRAIVDLERDHVFAVVSSDYRLITNQLAVELGEKCFRTVFHEDTADRMRLFSLSMPVARSFCHIDFTHEGRALADGSEWLPFLRVTNSYNRTKRLRFDLGFCRWLCENGMIVGGKNITFQYTHSTKDLGRSARFHLAFKDLRTVELQFLQHIEVLRNVHVPLRSMLPLLYVALQIRIDPSVLDTTQGKLRRDEFFGHVDGLSERYVLELGETAHAAFNLITDFASRPSWFFSAVAVVDRLQKRCGDWLGTFAREAAGSTFDLDEYLAPAARQLLAVGWRPSA